MKYLVIDACARLNSRTRKLCQGYLNTLKGEIKIVKLYDLNIKPLTEKDLNYRDNLINKNDYSDPTRVCLHSLPIIQILDSDLYIYI